MIINPSSIASELETLTSLERKLDVVRDFTTAVAKGFKFGLFLHGDGGTGKSFTVLNHLRQLEVSYQLHNSRMTGKGLFLALKQAPDVLHVFEDMERLTRDADAQGVLRSAMWAQPGHERVVTWTTDKDGLDRFVFRGGLILISNRPLADLPELRAMATRIEVLRLDVTEAEQVTRMRDLASRGYRHLDKIVIGPEECLEITEHILSECRAGACPLDLRLQQKSFQTYLQWESEMTNLHWKDLVAASIREASHHFHHESNTMPMETRRKQKRNLIRELMNATVDVKEQEQRYVTEATASRADFYRRKREVECGEFDEADAA